MSWWRSGRRRLGNPELPCAAGFPARVKRYDLDHPFTFTPEFKTREQWLARRDALRTQVLVAVGLWPMPIRTPLAPVVHGRIDRDGYTVEKVFFASTPGHYVTGNLYRPVGREGKRPAVLSPHGHWEGGRFLERPEKNVQALVGQGAERTPEAARYPLQARAANLARLGFVVFHYDMVGYADSKPLVHREGFADADAMLRLQSNMGLQTWNSVRALDFVTSLPDVDPSRVAMTGESGGGTQTILLSAIDDRLTASFPLVMVSGAMQGGCVCENAPLLRIGTNNIELAALFAPKPLGMSSANDWTSDLLKLGLPEIKTIYRLFDADDRVTAMYMPFEHGDHLPSRERMYAWFSTYSAAGRAAHRAGRRASVQAGAAGRAHRVRCGASAAIRRARRSRAAAQPRAARPTSRWRHWRASPPAIARSSRPRSRR